jgi:hypothetical protein
MPLTFRLYRIGGRAAIVKGSGLDEGVL